MSISPWTKLGASLVTGISTGSAGRLRRFCAEVLSQLPPRVDNTVFVPMTDQQMKHH